MFMKRWLASSKSKRRRERRLVLDDDDESQSDSEDDIPLAQRIKRLRSRDGSRIIQSRKPVERAASISSLPLPVLEEILSYLEARDLGRTTAASRLMRTVSGRDNLWRDICNREWPSSRNLPVYFCGKLRMYYTRRKNTVAIANARKENLGELPSRSRMRDSVHIMVDLVVNNVKRRSSKPVSLNVISECFSTQWPSSSHVIFQKEFENKPELCKVNMLDMWKAPILSMRLECTAMREGDGRASLILLANEAKWAFHGNNSFCLVFEQQKQVRRGTRKAFTLRIRASYGGLDHRRRRSVLIHHISLSIAEGTTSGRSISWEAGAIEFDDLRWT